MEPLRVSVIIVTWNSADVLGACLASLERQSLEGGFETIVVDNASSDGTVELLRGHGDRVRLIANEHNARYAGANNQGAEVARGRVLVFLNPDTELLAPDVLETLARAAEQREVGIAGPMLVNPDGTLQPSCAAHPSIAGSLVVGSGLARLLPDPLRARLVPATWSHDRALDADWLMGAALAVRAEVFERLGGFWPTMYAEDQDLAYRAQQLGLRVRFVPETRVMHVGNHSGAQRWSDADRAERIAAADLEFLLTHYGRLRSTAIRAVQTAAFGLRALALSLLRRAERAAVYRRMARVYAGGTPRASA